MKKLSTILAAILLTATVWAQTPEKMSYQAVIRNSSDALVTNTQVGMQISILQGSASGTVVYSETQTPTTNANGLVSIEIGEGAGFNSIDWASDIYFIKTETDLSGGTNYTITGTSQLLSVPYALHAKTAETVTGSITETDPVFSAWDKSTGISITESQVSDLGTYLEAEADPEFTSWDKSAGISITENQISDLGTYLETETDPVFTAWDKSIGILITESQISDLGTYIETETDPEFTAWDKSTGISIGESQISDLGAYLETETDPIFFAHPAKAITGTNISNWNTAYSWGNHSGLYRLLSYVPAWSEITGKPTTIVGFGITDAMNTSHAANAITSTNITNWSSAYGWGDHSAKGYFASGGENSGTNRTLGNKDDFSLGFKTNNETRIFISNDGKVGIGTNTPAQLFHISDSEIPGNGVDDDWDGEVDEIDHQLVFTKYGRLGIKTTNPTATLDVEGNVRIFDGTQGAGKVLTSDASGLASWQAAGGGGGWGLTGNAGTDDVANFIGTTDSKPFNIRVNDQKAGRIEYASGGNTFFGYQSGNVSNNLAGNTGIGYQALFSNTTGTGNTALGYNANVTTGSLSNATAIGYNAKVSASNSLVLGGTAADAVNVGIGVTAPAAKLDISSGGSGALINLDATTKYQTSATIQGVKINLRQTDAMATIYGVYSEVSLPAGSSSGTLYGLYSKTYGASGTNYGLYIEPVTGGQNNNYSIYSAGGKSYFSGNVGIGVTNPGVALDVTGQVKIVDGTQGAGKVLTSDASGVATWQAAGGGGSSLAIGDSYQGGIVFWLDATGEHGLIAATADQSTGMQWYNGSNTVTNAVRDGIGAGMYNTERIIANQEVGNYAAQLCANYQGGGYGDWYLPSKYELNLLYLQKSVVGGFTNNTYWSSSEGGNNNVAWGQYFLNGFQSNTLKNYATNVRAIRAF